MKRASLFVALVMSLLCNVAFAAALFSPAPEMYSYSADYSDVVYTAVDVSPDANTVNHDVVNAFYEVTSKSGLYSPGITGTVRERLCSSHEVLIDTEDIANTLL